LSNTTSIINTGGPSTGAAGLCNAYSYGGYSDWYLPASRELALLMSQYMLLNQVLENDGDPLSNVINNEGIPYWPSTEFDATQSYAYIFHNVHFTFSQKQFARRVRAIRAFNVPPFSCGDPTTVLEVTNPITGDIWMDRDLGAYQQATSSQDTASFGYLYQWGRFTDGHQCRNSTTTTTNATSSTPNDGNVWDEKFITEPNNPQDWLVPQDNTLWQGLNGTNNPCPVGFRIPTIIELEAERLSWASSDRAGAYDSPLKFAVGGFRATTGNILTVGANTYNWSSTVIGTESYYLFSTNSTAGTYDDASRANGMGIRCIKD